MSVIVRWVERPENIECVVKIRQKFLGFIAVTDASVAGLTTIVTAFLQKLGLDIGKLRGQGYDRASLISRGSGGVQKLFRDSVANAGPALLYNAPAITSICVAAQAVAFLILCKQSF